MCQPSFRGDLQGIVAKPRVCTFEHTHVLIRNSQFGGGFHRGTLMRSGIAVRHLLLGRPATRPFRHPLQFQEVLQETPPDDGMVSRRDPVPRLQAYAEILIRLDMPLMACPGIPGARNLLLDVDDTLKLLNPDVRPDATYSIIKFYIDASE